MRIAPKVVLTNAEHDVLLRLAQSRRTPARVAQRARIVLLAAKGLQNKQIAVELNVGRVQVARWRERYRQAGMSAIEGDRVHEMDLSDPGVRSVEVHEIPSASSKTQGVDLVALGAPDTRRMPPISNVAKRKLMRDFDFARNARLVARLEDIVGLYMSPNTNALVLSCDDHDEAKRQNGRSQTRRTPQAHRPMAWTDDELRAGARNLFAALGLLDNALAALGNQPSSQTGLLAFLRQIDRETPSGKTLHVIASSQAVDMPPATKKWLAGHARVHMHCAPISVPWISSVAWFFSQIDVALLRGSAFANLPELIAAIEDHTAPKDADVQAFTWTRTATVPRSAGARPVAAARLARGSPAGVDSLRDDVTALKRERILQEAARLFFEQGYLQTSVDAIAERLGVTKPFVYYHFNSKVDILVEICERSNRAAVAAAASALSARGSPRVRFEQFLREFTDVVLRDHQMVAIYFREQISLPEKTARRIDEMRKSIDVRLTALLVEGIHSGEFQIEDPRIGALVIAGMSSFAFAWYREHGRLDQQEVTDRIVRMALKLVSANPYYQAAAYPVASRPHLAADT